MSTTANLGMTLPAGTDWADIAVLNANFELIDAAMGAARAAEPYSAAKTYAVGDYCTRNGALFKCIVAITAPEVWTAGHWTATSVAAELLAIIASLSNKADKTAPTEYDLPLAAGWSGTLKYFKTQESVCIVTGTLTKDSQFAAFEVVATLPAGYKPATSASFPAVAFAAHTSLSITAADNGQLSLGDSGGLTTQRVLFFNISFVAGN